MPESIESQIIYLKTYVAKILNVGTAKKRNLLFHSLVAIEKRQMVSPLLNFPVCKNVSACLFSVHTINLSSYEQECLMWLPTFREILLPLLDSDVISITQTKLA